MQAAIRHPDDQLRSRGKARGPLRATGEGERESRQRHRPRQFRPVRAAGRHPPPPIQAFPPSLSLSFHPLSPRRARDPRSSAASALRTTSSRNAGGTYNGTSSSPGLSRGEAASCAAEQQLPRASALICPVRVQPHGMREAGLASRGAAHASSRRCPIYLA
eukprot:365847-Chlamydomonas_euryale.AAC.19